MRQGARGVHAPTEHEIAIHLKAARALGHRGRANDGDLAHGSRNIPVSRPLLDRIGPFTQWGTGVIYRA
jgi:hypothetical protein